MPNVPASRWNEVVDLPLTRLELAALWNVFVACPLERKRVFAEEKGPEFEAAMESTMEKINAALSTPSTLGRAPLPGAPNRDEQLLERLTREMHAL